MPAEDPLVAWPAAWIAAPTEARFPNLFLWTAYSIADFLPHVAQAPARRLGDSVVKGGWF